MKIRFYFIPAILLFAYLLSACGGTIQTAEQPATHTAAVKVQAVEVAFTGVVEEMSGDEWTINGQVLAVDPAIVRDGPFQVGDTIKVEGTVNTDGSLSISRVEAPTAAELSDLPRLGNDNANSNDANSNDGNVNTNEANGIDGDVNANTNDANTNGAATNANSNDDASTNTNTNVDSNDNDNGSVSNENSNANSNDDDSSNENNNNEDDDDNSNGNSNENSNENSNDKDDD